MMSRTEFIILQCSAFYNALNFVLYLSGWEGAKKLSQNKRWLELILIANFGVIIIIGKYLVELYLKINSLLRRWLGWK